jgi:hypothetical protein
MVSRVIIAALSSGYDAFLKSTSLHAGALERQPQLRLAEAVLTTSDELETALEKESRGEVAAIVTIGSEFILRGVGALIARPGVGIGKDHLESPSRLEETVELCKHSDGIVSVLERVGTEDRTKTPRLKLCKIVHVELFDTEAAVSSPPRLAGGQLHSDGIAETERAQRFEPNPITTSAIEQAQVQWLAAKRVLDEAPLPLRPTLDLRLVATKLFLLDS